MAQKKYKVQHDYRAGTGAAAIQLEKGKTVELSEEEAAWINRDSPGTLEEVKPRRRAKKAPAQNRQVTAAEDRGSQEEITQAGFGAVKDKEEG